jgi:predicted HAD superfamily Cof-like phosphohydrolase
MYNDVVKFIEACEQAKTQGNVELYQKLIREEFDEFIRDYFAGDKIGQLDGCMDLIWVTLGYCYMQGFDVDGAWAEVARSNLSKIDPVTGKVLKRNDGKVLKPDGWTPPDLAPFVK